MLIRHKNSGVFSKAFTDTAGSTTLTMLKMGALSTTSKLLRMMHDCSHPVNMLDDASTPIHELAVRHVTCAHYDDDGHVR